MTTPKDGLVADDLITGQLADVAASTMGTMLSEATTENILVGFTTIGDQIGDAADGALKLASGARDAATGAAAIPDGATKLASGAGELGTGASSLASGLDTIAGKTREAAAGAAQIGSGLTAGGAALQQNIGGTQELVGAIQGASASAKSAADGSLALAGRLGALQQTACATPVRDQAQCDLFTSLASDAGAVAQSAGTASGTLNNEKVAGGVAALPGTFSTLASSMTQAGAGATQLSSGLTQLADQGIGASAAGARGLASGATQLSSGATALADGATELTTGLDTLATGTGDLAGGLRTASRFAPLVQRHRIEVSRLGDRRPGVVELVDEHDLRPDRHPAARCGGALVRRTRDLRGDARPHRTHAHLSPVVGDAHAAGVRSRGSDRRGSGTAGLTDRAGRRQLRCGYLVGLRRDRRARRCRVRRREPGARRPVRRDRTLDLGPGRSARGRDGGGLVSTVPGWLAGYRGRPPDGSGLREG